VAESIVEHSVTAPMTALVLLFKRPLLGQGKQRLAKSLGLERTLILAERFLDCALEDLEGWTGPVVLAPAHAADREWAKTLWPQVDVIPQGMGELGQRILDLDRLLRNLGHERLIYMGSDAPVLSSEHYRSAGQRLGASDVVLSAADDGGVTLMGSTQPWPVGLLDLPWSTEQLGHALADCCRASGFSVGYIAPSYDIDLEADLSRLAVDLAKDTRPARQRLYQLLLTLNRSEPCDNFSADACSASH